MGADVDIDLGDFEAPVVQEEPQFDDVFAAESKPAFRAAFVGCGQAGGKLVEAFYDLGYRRVCAVNTTSQDLAELKLPVAAKLDLGGRGAAKDPEVAAKAVAGRDEDIFDLFTRNWGPDVDYVLVCMAAGGGTGAGIYETVVKVAGAYFEKIGRPVKVGVITALPKSTEGARPAANACVVLDKLKASKLSPIILVDNERIEQLHPRLSIAKFFKQANDAVAKQFHLLNRLAAQSSEHASFDAAEFGSLLDSGLVTFGAQKVDNWHEATAVAKAVRTQLQKTLLVPVDATTASAASLVFVVGEAIHDEVPRTSLDDGFAALNRIMPGATLFSGIYKGKGSVLLAFTMLGGLTWPTEKLDALRKSAGSLRVSASA